MKPPDIVPCMEALSDDVVSIIPEAHRFVLRWMRFMPIEDVLLLDYVHFTDAEELQETYIFGGSGIGQAEIPKDLAMETWRWSVRRIRPHRLGTTSDDRVVLRLFAESTDQLTTTDDLFRSIAAGLAASIASGRYRL